MNVAEFIFGLVISSCGFWVITLGFTIPVWLLGNPKSLGLKTSWLAVAVSSAVCAFVTKKYWQVSKGLCVGLIVGVALCAAALVLPPLH